MTGKRSPEAGLCGRMRKSGGEPQSAPIGSHRLSFRPVSVSPPVGPHPLPTDGSADAADLDFDGHTTWQEWRCLTDPTNALSALRLVSASLAGTNIVVSWQSVAGVNYFLERATNAAGPPPIFTPLASDIPGQLGTTTFTDTDAARLAPLFYRVGVNP